MQIQLVHFSIIHDSITNTTFFFIMFPFLHKGKENFLRILYALFTDPIIVLWFQHTGNSVSTRHQDSPSYAFTSGVHKRMMEE